MLGSVDSQKPILYLFSTGRALTAFYQRQEEGFLPYALKLEEFFSTLCLVEDRKHIPSSLRPIFLSLAAAGVAVEKLGFERNFLAFLENSPFFLSFFDELAAEKVSLDSLRSYDLYAHYEDHLGVLEKLLDAYSSLLATHGFYDRITLGRERIHFYDAFVLGYGEIVVFVDGFLSVMEVDLLRQAADLVPITWILEVDSYNLDYYQRVVTWERPLEAGYRYRLALKEGKILLQESLPPPPKIMAYSFRLRLDQAGLVFERIEAWMRSGIDPSKIAIVLPDESFSDYLKLLDTPRNLNYAMGESLSKQAVYRRLQSLLKDKEGSLIAWPSSCGLAALLDLSEILKEEKVASEMLLEVREFLLPLENLLAEKSVKEMLQIVLRELQGRTMDDVGGGKIRVMGVLETRGVELERIVMVDFNEGCVPKSSDKDLFLNSKIRAGVGLPTRLDRENLQKHYYFSLFRGCSEVHLAYLESEPSRMLRELCVDNHDGNALYAGVLFPATPLRKPATPEPIIGRIPYVEEKFSHTRLQAFFECKRRYYYRYVKRYSEREEPAIARDVSSVVHRTLAEIFSPALHLGAEERYELFSEKLLAACPGDPLMDLEMQYTSSRAKDFFESEKRRAGEGIVPLYCEYPFEFRVEGVLLGGKIDRVDQKPDGSYVVIDYKLKRSIKSDTTLAAVEKSSDFQLAIYALALKQLLGEARIEACYYDFYRGKLIYEDLLEEKIERLRERLGELKSDPLSFELSESLTPCRNCSYAAMCGREV